MELKGTTSLVGTSFIAYLTSSQVDQFSKDKRVKLITQDAYISPSALWNSTGLNYWEQHRSWGLSAMVVDYAGASNGIATVYVLDTGVEMHPDLPGLSAYDRLTALDVTTTYPPQPISPTGCYAHSTHVAGIIGAADNNVGVVGVLPGVRIVSIAVGDVNNGSCSTGSGSGGGYLDSAFIQGLEKIKGMVLQSNRVGVVNISFNNFNLFLSTGTLGQKMKNVATAVLADDYPGALVVQSAGNQLSDACGYAYNAPNAGDGILVVGGLDDGGQRVVPVNGRGGYINDPNPLNDEAGSNVNTTTGNCVDVWAPSQRIKSTWANGSYIFLSGTSMAAPHVSGFAARLLESNLSITTSHALEAAVRAHLTIISGSNLTMPRLLNIDSVTAAPTVEIVEGTDRSTVALINFSKFASAIDLRFQAIGASSCTVYVERYISYGYSGYWDYASWLSFSAQQLQSQISLAGNIVSLQAGYLYRWTVTCTSAQGTTSAALASGYIKRVVTLNWYVSTTSTGNIWQAIPNGGSVTWSAVTNAPFSQYYQAYGADYCNVRSYGFHGVTSRDADNPNYQRYSPFGYTFTQSNPPLWDSGWYYPSYYQFATFSIGDPLISPYGSYDGFKWLLTCWNYDGDSKQTVMYGTSLN